jgi:MarR family transcriptional regulator, organic hydroperoxide resistance regulator
MMPQALTEQLEGHGASVPPLGGVFDFMRSIWALHHALQTASKRMNRTLGVTGPQRLVIRLVGRFPGLTAKRLASVLRVHPSTVSGIVKRLERRGLVERRRDTRDHRRVYLGLTARGRELDTEDGATIEAAVQRTLDSESPSAVEQARQVLTTLTRELT